MAAKQASPAKDLRECPVCLDDMMNKSPKLLECKHSYCMSCLSGLAVKHGTSGLKVPCPKCKHDTVVNSGQLCDLPDNFLLQEVKAILDDHSRYYYCFYCSQMDKEARAVGQCITCHRFMCEDCSEKHKKTPRFMKHEIIVVTEEKLQEHCQKHSQPAAYVCLACSPNRLLCDVCMMLDAPCHPDNNLVDYTTHLSNEESNLRSKLDQLNNVDKFVSEMEERKLKEITKANDNAMFIIDGIERALEDVKREIEKSMSIASLKLAADGVKKSKAKALELLKDNIRRLEGIHEADEEIKRAFNKYTEERKKVKDKSFHLDNDSQIWRELLNIEQTLSRMFNDRPRLVFSWPTNGIVRKLTASANGRVLYVCKKSSVIMEICKEGKTRQLNTDHLGYDYVSSADICDDHIYIVCCSLLKSALYQCKLSSDLLSSPFATLSSQDRLKLYRGFVTELCACHANGIIFAWTNGMLWKTNRSKVLCSPYRDNQVQLTRFNTDDKLRFIATYVTHQTVLLHDTEGRTLQTISKNGSPVMQPRAATVNAQGNILIADSGTCKIVELTVEGTFVRNVLSKEDGLQNPINVVYSSPYLWVADQVKGNETVLKCYNR